MKTKTTFLILFLLAFANSSQSQNFITEWTFPSASSTITFRALTVSGPVNYTWSASPSGTSGSGSFTQTTPGLVSISGLTIAAGDVVTLSMTPTNLRRFYMTNLENSVLTNVTQWGSVPWSSMQDAFKACSALQISATDIPNLAGVSSMSSMFASCTNLNGPSNINSWNTAAVTNMNEMFRSASKFNQDIGNWNTAAVTNMGSMFSNAKIFNQNIGNWNTAAVKIMNFMFSDASAFNQDIGNWNTAAVTNMGSMFSYAFAFNQNIGNWNTAAVTDMSSMFRNASAFNQAIGNWNTAAVTDMNLMFNEAFAFNQAIGNWNTAAVTRMINMFFNASAFNQDIGNWNTAAVKTMNAMFAGATQFNQNISNWNTTAVISMNSMFSSASAFNQDIGSWNTAAVTDMRFMFSGASAFNQSIGNWMLNPNVTLQAMLNLSGMDCNNYSATLIGWAANNPTVTNRNLGALNRIYGTSAVAARTILVNSRGWILNDSTNGDLCGGSLSTLDYDLENQISIYPNPANEYLTINYKTNQKQDISVYSSLGKLLATYNNAENNFQVPVAHLANGLYVVTVRDDSGNTATLKFVKNN